MSDTTEDLVGTEPLAGAAHLDYAEDRAHAARMDAVDAAVSEDDDGGTEPELPAAHFKAILREFLQRHPVVDYVSSPENDPDPDTLGVTTKDGDYVFITVTDG